jgi:hypothetical protein
VNRQWKIVLVVISAGGLMLGCQTSPRDQSVPPVQPQPEAVIEMPEFDPLVAAIYTERRIRQEVLLHAAMYRAAFESRVPGGPSYFVLEPVQEDHPPDLGAVPADFRVRVLTELAGLGAPLAWAPSTWRTPAQDFFPGTNQPATRLQIRILQRIDEQATVIGEVADRTAGIGSSRQGVIATWDGERWNIERDRVRVEW